MASSKQKRRAIPLLEAIESRTHLSAQQLDGYVVQGYSFSPQDAIPSVTVFADANGNSSLDEGETSTTCDDTGHFSIVTDVDPLKLRAVLPDKYVFHGVGWSQVTGSPPVYYLQLPKIRPITGSVYADLNNDQQPDDGDRFFSDVPIYVDTNSNGHLDDGDNSVLTDADGHYSLETIESPGRLRIAPPAGWVSNDFGLFLPGDFRNFRLAPAPSVSGTLYNDTNLSGTRNDGEVGVAGLSLFLDYNNNGALDAGEPSTLTDADGHYQLQSASTGAVRVRLAGHDGWSELRTNAYINAAPDRAYSLDVSIYRSITVGGILFQDTNRNGIRDLGESGIADAEVYSHYTYGPTTPAQIIIGPGSIHFLPFDFPDVVLGDFRPVVVRTADDGSFILSNVPRDHSTLSIDPDKFVRTTPSDAGGESQLIGALPIPPGGFGVAEVHGRVFDDANNNGRFDDGEMLLPGMIVVAGEPGQPGVFSNYRQYANGNDISDADGNFTIVGLRQGNFRLSTTAGPKPFDSDPIDFTLQKLEVKTIDLPVHLYCVMHGTIVELWNNQVSQALTVYIDQNNNGQLDDGELSTESFYGDYYFRRVPEGPYTVRIANSNITINSTLPSGVARRDQAIENAPIEIDFTVMVQVYYDANGNGRKDAFEPYLDNISVFVDANNNKQADARETRRVKARNGKAPISVHLGKTRIVLRSLAKFRKKQFSGTLTINITDPFKAPRLLIGLRPER